MKKIISILLIMIFIIATFNVSVNAAFDINSVITDMNGASNLGGPSKISNTINKIIGLMQVAGTGIALVVITLLGIKYMLASPSEKADTKKMIMPILIGCILLFAAVNIVSTILDLVGVLE